MTRLDEIKARVERSLADVRAFGPEQCPSCGQRPAGYHLSVCPLKETCENARWRLKSHALETTAELAADATWLLERVRVLSETMEHVNEKLHFGPEKPVDHREWQKMANDLCDQMDRAALGDE